MDNFTQEKARGLVPISSIIEDQYKADAYEYCERFNELTLQGSVTKDERTPEDRAKDLEAIELLKELGECSNPALAYGFMLYNETGIVKQYWAKRCGLMRKQKGRFFDQDTYIDWLINIFSVLNGDHESIHDPLYSYKPGGRNTRGQAVGDYDVMNSFRTYWNMYCLLMLAKWCYKQDQIEMSSYNDVSIEQSLENADAGHHLDAELADKTNYSREEYVYLAKLYEKAQRFPDMVKSINKFVELDPKLTRDERNILSAGYKNIVSDKRASWRLLNSMEKKEEKKNSAQTENIRLVKNNIEKELNEICNEIQLIIDNYLVPNASDSETKVFFLKLKGDYYRYKCEFATGKEFLETCSKAEKVYKEAYDLANKDIPISSSTRLGLALNYSVFFYEIKGLKEEACNIAKNAFDEAMKVLDDLEKSKPKDTILIIQLLKENLILWSNEMNDDEQN